MIKTWRYLKETAFHAWVQYVEDMRKKRLIECKMKYWKAEIVLKKWTLVIEDLNRHSMIENFASCARKRRYFMSWRKATVFLRKFSLKRTRNLKKIALASNLMKILFYRFIARKMLYLWQEHVWMWKRLQYAKYWNDMMCTKRYFLRWVQIIDLVKNGKNSR